MAASDSPPKTILFIDQRHIVCGHLKWASADGDGYSVHPSESQPPDEAISHKRLVPHGIRLVAQKATKHEPVTRGEGIPARVIYSDGVYRAWNYTPQAETILYRESKDGFAWQAPVECTLETHGERPVGEGSAFIDMNAPPAKRYKFVYNARVPVDERETILAQIAEMPRLYRDNRLLDRSAIELLAATYGAVSSDGIRWTGIRKPLLLHKADTDVNCYYDTPLKKYVIYSRLYRQDRRWVGRAESDDFREWGPLKPLIRPPLDGALHDDIYTNAHTTYPGLPDHHLMFPMTYHRHDESSDVHLYTSEDGVSWARVPGGPVLCHGEPAEWDGAFIVAGRDLVPLGSDRIAIPYHGTSYPHKYPRWPEVVSARGSGWASWPEGRLCAVRAEADGAFSTLPLPAAGRSLRVNARVQRGGEIRIGVERLEGDRAEDTTAVTTRREIATDGPGRSITDCDPIFGDHLARTVSWKGDPQLALAEGEMVRLHFRMRSADLFSLQWQ